MSFPRSRGREVERASLRDETSPASLRAKRREEARGGVRDPKACVEREKARGACSTRTSVLFYSAVDDKQDPGRVKTQENRSEKIVSTLHGALPKLTPKVATY